MRSEFTLHRGSVIQRNDLQDDTVPQFSIPAIAYSHLKSLKIILSLIDWFLSTKSLQTSDPVGTWFPFHFQQVSTTSPGRCRRSASPRQLDKSWEGRVIDLNDFELFLTEFNRFECNLNLSGLALVSWDWNRISTDLSGCSSGLGKCPR